MSPSHDCPLQGSVSALHEGSAFGEEEDSAALRLRRAGTARWGPLGWGRAGGGVDNRSGARAGGGNTRMPERQCFFTVCSSSCCLRSTAGLTAALLPAFYSVSSPLARALLLHTEEPSQHCSGQIHAFDSSCAAFMFPEGSKALDSFHGACQEL